MFPNDAKNHTLDIHTGTSGLFLSSVNYDRTILYASMYCKGNGDNALVIGETLTQPNDNDIIDTEDNPAVSLPIYRTLPANSNINWIKTNTNDKCNYQIIYTDYLLASSTASTTTSFSGGEIVNSVFLFMILIVLMYTFMYYWIFGFKIRKY